MTEYVYGAEPLGPRIVEVCSETDYRLLLSFDNGERRMFDARPLLSVKAFAPLRSESFFRLAHVAFGTVAWPGDIDCCADTLYQQSALLS